MHIITTTLSDGRRMWLQLRREGIRMGDALRETAGASLFTREEDAQAAIRLIDNCRDDLEDTDGVRLEGAELGTAPLMNEGGPLPRWVVAVLEPKPNGSGLLRCGYVSLDTGNGPETIGNPGKATHFGDRRSADRAMEFIGTRFRVTERGQVLASREFPRTGRSTEARPVRSHDEGQTAPAERETIRE